MKLFTKVAKATTLRPNMVATRAAAAVSSRPNAPCKGFTKPMTINRVSNTATWAKILFSFLLLIYFVPLTQTGTRTQRQTDNRHTLTQTHMHKHNMRARMVESQIPVFCQSLQY